MDLFEGGESLRPDQSSIFDDDPRASSNKAISLDDPQPGTSSHPADADFGGGDFGTDGGSVGLFEGGLFDEPSAPTMDHSVKVRINLLLQQIRDNCLAT